MNTQVPLSDAWSDPQNYNSRYIYAMDKRQRHILELFTGDSKSIKKALHFIRSGMKEEVEMKGISFGGRAPLEELDDV